MLLPERKRSAPRGTVLSYAHAVQCSGLPTGYAAIALKFAFAMKSPVLSVTVTAGCTCYAMSGSDTRCTACLLFNVRS
eukprot:580512-Rhodomonas_salina.2